MHAFRLGLIVLLGLLPAAGSAAEATTVEQFERAARTASDIRLRILFSIDGPPRMESPIWRETIPLETLVEQARGSTDPLVLSLLVNRCSGSDATRCDALALARRWTVADTQNQVAWLTLAAVLRSRGEKSEADRAVLRAAEASVWREPMMEIARLVARQLPRSETPRERLAALRTAFGIAAANATPYSPEYELGQACRAAVLLAACVRLLDTSYRDTELLSTVSLAAPYTERAGLPREVVEERQRRANALLWGSRLGMSGNAAEAEDDTRVEWGVQRFEAMLAFGQVKATERTLADARISQTEAAQRWAATNGSERLGQQQMEKP